jgi:hypothetical protein
LPFLHAPEKVIIGPIHPFHSILKHLRRHVAQFRADLLAFGQFRALMGIGKRDPSHAIRAFALIERRIVHLAAKPKPYAQGPHLLLCGVDAVLIGFRGLFELGLLWLLRLFLRFLRHAFAARCTA